MGLIICGGNGSGSMLPIDDLIKDIERMSMGKVARPCRRPSSETVKASRYARVLSRSQTTRKEVEREKLRRLIAQEELRKPTKTLWDRLKE